MIYCVSSKALNTFFNIAANVDVIVVKDYELFSIYLDGYKYLFDTPNVAEVVHYEDFGVSYETWKEAAKANEGKVNWNHRVSPFRYRKQQNQERWITSSIIDVNQVNENMKQDRFDSLAIRSMKSGDIKTFLNIMELYPDFKYLGDTRSFNSSEELIEKLDAAQHSKMYIGSACSWHKITAKFGASCYPIINMKNSKSIKRRSDLITTTLLDIIRH